MKTVMDGVRERIADDSCALPGLHKQALKLKLHPQPWWDRDFYEWAIKQAQA